MNDATLLAIHAGATFFMTGLIWFVQIVHYPLMRDVGTTHWAAYEGAHVRRTSYVVAPMMLLETIAALLIVLAPDTTSPLAWIAGGLLVLIWLSTFVVQVPLHGRLTEAFDSHTHRRLVETNWIRTVAWSGRAVLAALMIQ